MQIDLRSSRHWREISIFTNGNLCPDFRQTGEGCELFLFLRLSLMPSVQHNPFYGEGHICGSKC